MLNFGDNLLLKILAWFLHYLLYIYWFVIKFFLNKGKNNCKNVQAPQYPRTIVVTGASQGLFI
jgi:hypothetical protein